MGLSITPAASLVFPGTLVVASGKTATINNTLTLVGTDGTTMTFPTTSATVARTDAANAFTLVTTTATSGIVTGQTHSGTANPSSTSTMVYQPFTITPTINYSAGTPGAGSYEALKIAVTETALPTGTNYLIRASAGAAGTTDKFTVTNNGFIGIAFLTGSNSIITYGSGSNGCVVGWRSDVSQMYFQRADSTSYFNVGTTSLNVPSAVGFGSATSPTAFIISDAANTLAQRNGTAAQTLRVYNTFTTVATAGEWWKADWNGTANQFRMGAVAGSSSGTNRAASWDYGDKLASATAAITVPATSGSIAFGGGLAFGSNLAISNAVPTISSGFGSGATIAGIAGGFRITCGITPGTGGTVAFNTTYANAPVCFVQDETTGVLGVAAPTTTTVVISGLTLLSGQTIAVLVFGY